MLDAVPRAVAFETRDYEANVVRLYQDRYDDHICLHREMEVAIPAIQRTVEDPGLVVGSTAHASDLEANAEWRAFLAGTPATQGSSDRGAD